MAGDSIGPVEGTLVRVEEGADERKWRDEMDRVRAIHHGAMNPAPLPATKYLQMFTARITLGMDERPTECKCIIEIAKSGLELSSYTWFSYPGQDPDAYVQGKIFVNDEDLTGFGWLAKGVNEEWLHSHTNTPRVQSVVSGEIMRVGVKFVPTRLIRGP